MRLIDADKLLTVIPSEEINAKLAIVSAPTIEAETVKRGKWIIRPHRMMGECPCCSECGSFNPIGYRYCPNCGAKMEPISESPENGQEAEE